MYIQVMKTRWSEEKNKQLQEMRGVGFEEILDTELIDVIPHPNAEKYPNQYQLLFYFNSYVYYVPCVIEDDGTYFLKTIIPSRKLTKKYYGK